MSREEPWPTSLLPALLHRDTRHRTVASCLGRQIPNIPSTYEMHSYMSLCWFLTHFAPIAMASCILALLIVNIFLWVLYCIYTWTSKDLLDWWQAVELPAWVTIWVVNLVIWKMHFA
ncbi:hypothetical protein P154DRAFT_358210 [Amniculicola lignicola CBS 123094]|uniref:Uncharacterized protein n=1 Tax=Amniculicola lignicola CBS 123094 TaxID=1392246 RepID=A0A6A5X2E6_9PLEO|nr:hypothetical protein P154DRAFT_358210 [Amniculicola lignicola CBS 123094]